MPTTGPGDPFANRYPADTPEVVPRCTLELRHGRWRTVSINRRSVRTARGPHIFVVHNGRLLIAKVRFPGHMVDPIGHIDLAGGANVEFAGEVASGSSRGSRGTVKFWNDQTGHYDDPLRPMNPDAVSWLPLDRFERTRGR